MTEKEMIEEMARTIGGCHTTPSCKACDEKSGTTSCYNKKGAKTLYNAGYRKIPEGAVVLTREENEKWIDFLELNIKKARKETARELLDGW